MEGRSNSTLQRLSEAKYCVTDATFDSVPGLFRQLSSIHASRSPNHQHTFPAFYALVTSKCEGLYRKVLIIVGSAKERSIYLDVSIILPDFEKAIINSCEAEFPDSKHFGCLFKFSKNHYRHIQQNKLHKTLPTDSSI